MKKARDKEEKESGTEIDEVIKPDAQDCSKHHRSSGLRTFAQHVCLHSHVVSMGNCMGTSTMTTDVFRHPLN